MNSFVLSLCFVLAFSSFVFAETVSYKVDYVLKDDNLYPNGEIYGTLYYKYDTAQPRMSKVRYEHSFYVGARQTVVVELEDFNAGRIFKICGESCESYPLTRNPQQWWYQEQDAKRPGEAIDGFDHYTRSVLDYGVTDLWLKNEDTPSNTFYLKKLIFSSGRILNFVDGTYAPVDPTDSKFDPNAGGVQCSTENCRTYMDLIFLLDSSGSVGERYWPDMVKFVKNVVKGTDISAQSGAIAVIGFGGNMSDKAKCLGRSFQAVQPKNVNRWFDQSQIVVLDNGKSEVYYVKKNNKNVLMCGYMSNTFYPPDNRTICEEGYNEQNGYTKALQKKNFIFIPTENIFYEKGTVKKRCVGTYANYSQGDDIFIAGIHVPLTYAPKEDIMNEIDQKAIYIHGDTCQAHGYLKAMEIFHRNERAKENGGLVPARVVIGLTDGEDHCANETIHYADVIKRIYNATLIEVGIDLKHYYDKELLQNISSTFAGIPAYFDVKSFAALQELIDKVVGTVCQTDYSEATGKCDMKCNGFCGCGGECLCPTCDSSLNNECHHYSCEVTNNVTAGCVDDPTDCNDGKYCTSETCVVGTGCVFTNKSCDENLKTCQVSKCSEDLEGDCDEVKNYSSLCPEYDYPCYTAICDPDSPDANSVSGCRYEYKCVGKLPVVYNEDGSYSSGCYRYTCDNNTGECGTTDVCEEMSNTNLCTEFVCNERFGRCMERRPKVTCPPETPCRPQSTCNPLTGHCDMINVTASDCKNAFKREAAKHLGKPEWFGSVDDIEAYYNCGEAVCDDSATGQSHGASKLQNEFCLFTPGNATECGACNGTLSTQVSYEECEDMALALHDENPEICYVSTCRAVDDVTSVCEFTNITCEHKGCMNVFCNQSTLQCEYSWTDDYLAKQSEVNACNELQCIDDEAKLVDITARKCLGDAVTNSSVPVCKLFDRCDAKAGCIYKEKCVRTNNCTTMTCDVPTNECVEKPIVCRDSENICFHYECMKKTDNCEIVLNNVKDVCGTTDKCHSLSCSAKLNKCVSEEIPYPNETDKCHIYTCENNTGLWTVTDKCDDNNICTEDICIPYDGTCTNFKRDCHEINMTGFGVCFGRACSKSRKNGCFRKVYENSYFDECGNCIRGYSAGDSGVTESEVSECKKALSFQEEAAVISAGVLAGIILACVIGAVAVSTAGTLATKELIKRARAASSNGAHDNPLFEDDGEELQNPTFVGTA